ncbi:NUDIX hydrolase [Candidatus Woesearchaeota archaeon]|nr:NUDIX hydrolase [Candidatus Woesearchaeota archaeon]
MPQYSFQYCQKLVIFSKDKTKILLGKRKGEADYDGVFSFFAGKMETKDASILEGLKREKEEELGNDFKIDVYPLFTHNLFYTSVGGRKMILPHYYAVYKSGEITLNDEYSEARWVSVKDLDSFEPKVETIPDVVRQMAKLEKMMKKEDFVVM